MRELISNLRRLESWWREDLWSAALTSSKASPAQHFAVMLARTLYIVATGFRTERIKLRAALLTYTSLLSLVPALVVMFSAFAAFQGLAGVQDALKRFVVQSLAVSQQEVVMSYLDSFVTQAGALGTVGVLVLLVTTISLLVNIETAFNDIWGLRRGRSMVHRFQVYWPLVTLGPILVGLSLSLTAAVETSDTVRELAAIMPLVSFVFKLAPVLLTWVSMTLLYMLLPNTHVPFRAALVGGIVAGSLWELAKRLYAIYAGITLEGPSVYGSLAAVPLFILWIYVSWIVALLGATLTFAVQNAKTYEPEDLGARRSQHDRELLAARLLAAVSDSFERGRGPVPAQTLLDEIVVSPRFARQLLTELVESELLVETNGEGSEASYVPGRPLAMISLADVVHAIRGGAREERHALRFDDDDVLGRHVARALGDTERAIDGALASRSIAALVAAAREETAKVSSS